MLRTLFIVGIGGFAGSIARYILSFAALKTLPIGFPLGTLLANILGCFLIGIFYGCSDRYAWFSPELRIFLTAGFCGGFTTFSSFSYENIQLFESGRYLAFAIYVGGSFAISISATAAGIAIMR